MSIPGTYFHGQTIEGYIPPRRVLLKWLFTRRHDTAFIKVDKDGHVDIKTPIRVTGPLTIDGCWITCPPRTTAGVRAEAEQRRAEERVGR